MELATRRWKIWRLFIRFDTIHERDRWTHTHTDRRTDTAWRHKPRLCILSRDKNPVFLTSVENRYSYTRRLSRQPKLSSSKYNASGRQCASGRAHGGASSSKLQPTVCVLGHSEHSVQMRRHSCSDDALATRRSVTLSDSVVVKLSQREAVYRIPAAYRRSRVNWRIQHNDISLRLRL